MQKKNLGMSALFQVEGCFSMVDLHSVYVVAFFLGCNLNEPVHEKTNNLHRRKQRRRSASR